MLNCVIRYKSQFCFGLIHTKIHNITSICSNISISSLAHHGTLKLICLVFIGLQMGTLFVNKSTVSYNQ